MRKQRTGYGPRISTISINNEIQSSITKHSQKRALWEELCLPSKSRKYVPPPPQKKKDEEKEKKRKEDKIKSVNGTKS
jgi:hypothetical protein